MSDSTFNPEKIIETVMAALKAAGADKYQTSLTRSEKSELNVETGKLSLFRSTTNIGLGMFVLVGTQGGTTYLNKFDEESIKAATQQAVALAKASEPDEANDIAPLQPFARFVNGPAEPDPELMYQRLKAFLEYSRVKYPITNLEQCILDFTASSTYYANSNGARFEEFSGLYSFSTFFTSIDGQKTSSFNYTQASCRNLDKALQEWGSVDELLRQSAEQTETRPLEGTFVGQVLISPDCLSDFIEMLKHVYLDDYPIIRGSSPWLAKMGMAVSSPLVSIRCEPQGPLIQAGYGFTHDGFKAENCALIEKGVLKSTTIGRYAAKKTGKSRCVSGGGAITMDAGTSDFATMISSIKKGLFVTRFSGGEPAPNGDFSGVAKNSYLVENGKIVGPVNEAMITGNLEALFNAVSAVSAQRINYGSTCLPWILADGVGITGK